MRYNDFFFQRLGVHRADAERLHHETMEAVGLSIDESESFHRIIFAALKLSNLRPDNILELGTMRAETTAFLAELFPEAIVHTVELPESDPIWKRMHPEGDQGFVANCEGRLDRENIRSHRTNTAFLFELNLPMFDLIWLDAGHEYPEVAWDHFFCLSRLAPGGWLVSDDVARPEDFGIDKSAIYQVIQYYNERMPQQFDLLLKRESPDDYVWRPKYLGAFCNLKEYDQ